MSRTATVRKYGKSTRKQTAEVLFAQLPRTPVKSKPEPEPESEPEFTQRLDLETEVVPADEISEIAAQLDATKLDDTAVAEERPETRIPDHASPPDTPEEVEQKSSQDEPLQERDGHDHHDQGEQDLEEEEATFYDDLRILSWVDVCPAGDRIEKIAEASYAEVYRITNAHGTSIIKVVRLESPIKPQTKAQERSGLVDEEPHSEEDMQGELRISEWLADIPGFVVYKEQYVVKGKAPKALLETHQAFHRRMKRKDPDRLQYYPSPSRYLDDTRFLVVELGDAGTALEDFELTSISEVWDIFLHTALALARAEDMVEFEVGHSPSPFSLPPHN
jgi:serine/threonine-protein kinase haspin